jgi:NAD(P)-dependent dehydrogenase (short-subunit alcohol dehydrogenase family)
VLRLGQGRVVNVTSAAGRAGVPLMAPCVSAKHALEGLSDVMRLEFRQLGIQVAVIEPGLVGTAMGGKLQRDTEGVVGSLPDEGRRHYGPALCKLAEEIGQHAATGSPPEVVAKHFDRIILRASGLDGF